MNDLKNKNIIVTGASGGIGNSIVKRLYDSGAKILASGTRIEKLDELKKNFKNIKILKFDISQSDKVEEFIENATNELGGSLDGIINNAGITKDQLFLRMKDEDWDDVINTNLSSVFNITKVFIKSMVKQREGRVINISSVAGLMGNPGQVNYSSSKAAIGGFTKSLAKELASRNITVNSIAPGFISSDMTDALTDDQKSEILNQIPIRKFGDPKNIAELAVFLASEKGQYITGQTISVDGGLYMI